MTGVDSYKEFDNTSIVSSSPTQDTVKIGRVRLRKRDVLLGGIALIALLLVLILAIVLAVQVGNNDDDDNDKTGTVNAAQTGKTNTNDGDQSTQSTQSTLPPDSKYLQMDLCTSPPCLKTAHYQKSNMDGNFAPCQDFYSYACGSYDENNPQNYMLTDVTPAGKIQLDNIVRLLDLISFPVDRSSPHSYERKLKHFMSSCTNHFDKMDLRGRPLIDQVLSQVSPVYFLDDDFDAANVDLHAQLKKTHVDFWTAAFFTVNVVTDQEDWNKRIVELNYGGLGMPYAYFVSPQVSDQAIAIYKEYMTHILSLVSVDNGQEPDPIKIETFVNDVISIESNISVIVYSSPQLYNPHQEDVKMTLDQLTTLANNSLDFVDYMKSVFNEYPSMFNGETSVAVKRLGYFHYLGSYLSSLIETDEGKRQVNNYLVWTLINRFSHDLSWDYIHAKRKLNHLLSGQKDDSSGYIYCFQVAENTMADAMDAVFIKSFVKPEVKEEAHKVLEYIKNEMMTGIDSLPWMTVEDKRIASAKIRESLYKIGYADYMVDDDFLDTFYYPAAIDENDFFGNILNLNKLYRATYNRRIGNQGSRTLWAYHIFDPVVEYWNPWHELIVTAAVFQNPLFSHDGPAYYNFGSVGSIMAKHLIHAVDEYGNSFRLDGSHYGNWWANVTTNRYTEIRNCAKDVQKGFSLGTFTDPYTQLTVTPNISRFADQYVPELLADSSGLRLAYKAYKTRERSMGKENMPAGFPDLNIDQMFFISFAQANCQNTPDIMRFNQLYENRYPSKAKVNLAVSQVPEFARAFNCKPGQPMYAAKTCSLF